MKMRAPEGCCGLVHDGRFLAIGADGCVDIDAAEAAALAAHGFVAVPDAPAADDADAMPDIDAMGRSALFAYLRDRGVTVTLPITNEALRAAAREATGA
jgi:hypothetical protein